MIDVMLEKEYDRVSWDMILMVLEKKNDSRSRFNEMMDICSETMVVMSILLEVLMISAIVCSH